MVIRGPSSYKATCSAVWWAREDHKVWDLPKHLQQVWVRCASWQGQHSGDSHLLEEGLIHLESNPLLVSSTTGFLVSGGWNLMTCFTSTEPSRIYSEYFFCLQLEACCLQFSYLLTVVFGRILLATEICCWHLEFFANNCKFVCLQWESASNHPKLFGLQWESSLNTITDCRQVSYNCEQINFPLYVPCASWGATER